MLLVHAVCTVVCPCQCVAVQTTWKHAGQATLMLPVVFSSHESNMKSEHRSLISNMKSEHSSLIHLLRFDITQFSL